MNNLMILMFGILRIIIYVLVSCNSCIPIFLQTCNNFIALYFKQIVLDDRTKNK